MPIVENQIRPANLFENYLALAAEDAQWVSERYKWETKDTNLQALGYSKIVIVSESPLLHAAQLTNPGLGQRVRTLWRCYSTPDFAGWRELYASDDIVIKELPAPEPNHSSQNAL